MKAYNRHEKLKLKFLKDKRQQSAVLYPVDNFESLDPTQPNPRFNQPIHLNTESHKAPRAGGVLIFSDCRFVFKILFVSEFAAKDGRYKYENEQLENYTT